MLGGDNRLDLFDNGSGSLESKARGVNDFAHLRVCVETCTSVGVDAHPEFRHVGIVQ